MKVFWFRITLFILMVWSLNGCHNQSESENHYDHAKNEVHQAGDHHEHKMHDDHDGADQVAHSDVDGDHDNKEHVAEDEGASSIRQTDSHVHGDATLAIALDGQLLSLELETPLYNIVGFEHEPVSELDKKALRDAQSHLSNSAELFRFNAEAGCVGKNDMMPVSLFSTEDHDHHNEMSEDEDHQDVILEYKFVCEAPEKLSSVNLILFDVFPNMLELNTIYLGSTVQLQSRIKRGKTNFILSK